MSYNKTYKKFSKMTLTEKWKMEGLQQGMIEGQKKAILKSIQLKFGRVPKDLEKLISNINDLEELDKLFTKVFLANSLEELLRDGGINGI